MRISDNNGIVNRFQTERRDVDELFAEVEKIRSLKIIQYSLFIDTYNLFCHAREGLSKLYSDHKPNQTAGKENQRVPSAIEYVAFAEMFLRHVIGHFEDDKISKQVNGISEKALRAEIRELIKGRISPEEISEAEVIISFKKSILLFGAEFDKEHHAIRISKQIEWAYREKDTGEIDLLNKLKRRVDEDEEIVVGSRVKNYKFYNKFLEALGSRGDPKNVHGFYKFFIEHGKFKSHSEKAVDTSLAVKSISFAYEQPNVTQIFCIADTDFLPVFTKLEEIGIPYMVFLVDGKPKEEKKVPGEFLELHKNGRLVRLDFSKICTSVFEEFITHFMQGGTLLHDGGNADVYRGIANSRWEEIRNEWIEEMNEEWAKVYPETEAILSLNDDIPGADDNSQK